MKHVVKYDAYLDILLMGSVYVINIYIVRGKPISGQANDPLEPRPEMMFKHLWDKLTIAKQWSDTHKHTHQANNTTAALQWSISGLANTRLGC